MIQLKGMQVTLSVYDLQAATKFYSEVLGFRIVSEGTRSVVLSQGVFRLSLIKAEPGSTSSGQPAHLRWLVADPGQVDEVAERAKRLNFSILEDVHEQPNGTRTFTCLGPDEQLIEINAEPTQPQPEKSVTKTTQPTPESARPQAQVSTPPPATSTSPPTRADRYALEAQERLARIKEEFASLTTSFSQTDIAGTIDEMKQKIARRVIDVAEKVASPTEAGAGTPSASRDADLERKRREAEEALSRYKQQVIAPERLEPVKPEEEGLKPVRKTLGPAPDEKPPRE